MLWTESVRDEARVGFSVPGADVLRSHGTVGKRALEQSGAAALTPSACEVAWPRTSALELPVPHVEVAFGDCRLLPVMGCGGEGSN